MELVGPEPYLASDVNVGVYDATIGTTIRQYEESLILSTYPSWRLAVTDYDRVDGVAASEIRNPSFLFFLRKLLVAITSEASSSDEDLEERTRRWLRALRALSSGEFGSTLSSGIANIDKFFAIKYAHRGVGDVTHEYAVGITVNSMREQFIPNFVYTHYRTVCSAPIVNNATHQVLDWCRVNGEITSYLILENIGRSTSLLELIANGISFTDYLAIIFQLFLALHYANVAIKFTHWDAHTDNILVRSLEGNERGRWIRYAGLENVPEQYVATRGMVPVLIDFGMSSVQINDVLIGPTLGKSSNFNGNPNIYADVYRILISTYVDALAAPESIDRAKILRWIEYFLPRFWEGATLRPSVANSIQFFDVISPAYLVANFGNIGTDLKTQQIYAFLQIDDNLPNQYDFAVFVEEMKERANVYAADLDDIIRTSPTGLSLFDCSGTEACTTLSEIERYQKRPSTLLSNCYTIDQIPIDEATALQLANKTVVRTNYNVETIRRNLATINSYAAEAWTTFPVDDANVYTDLRGYAMAVLQLWLTYDDTISLTKEADCIAGSILNLQNLVDDIRGRLLNLNAITRLNSIIQSFTTTANLYLNVITTNQAIQRGRAYNDDFQWLVANLSQVVYTVNIEIVV